MGVERPVAGVDAPLPWNVPGVATDWVAGSAVEQAARKMEMIINVPIIDRGFIL
jgi:hypothetical protein